MSEVEKFTKEFQDIFHHYKQNQNRSLFQVFNDIRTSECNHKARTRGIHNKMKCFRVTNSCYQALFILIIFVLPFALYVMWFIRRYNHANTFGGCPKLFLWPFKDCPIVY